MKNSTLIYLLIMSFAIGFSSCKTWDEHYNNQIAESSILLWDAISADSQYSEFVQLATEVGLDTIINKDIPFTLFIPDNASLDIVNNANSIDEKRVLMEYLVTRGVILPSQFKENRQVATLSTKLLGLSKMNGAVFADDIEVKAISPMHKNGVYYTLNGYPTPRPNLEQLITKELPSLKAFIDVNATREVDWERSVVIGNNEQGEPVYDTVWIEENLFYTTYFPVADESRDLAATFVIFEEELYQEALQTKVKDVLKIDSVPVKWQNEVLFPYLMQNMAYEHRLDYSEFKDTMINIKGDSVKSNYELIDPQTKTNCSNGLAYFFTEVDIPSEMVLDTITIEGESLVTENNEWIDSLWTNDNSKIPRVTPSDIASGGASMSVPLARNGDEGYFIEFKVRNLFPIKYKLVWQAYFTPSALVKFSVNGVVVGEYDNFLFRKPDAWGAEEFDVNHLTEFGDVTIRLTVIDGGTYKTSNALFLDCVKLIPIIEE